MYLPCVWRSSTTDAFQCNDILKYFKSSAKYSLRKGVTSLFLYYLVETGLESGESPRTEIYWLIKAFTAYPSRLEFGNCQSDSAHHQRRGKIHGKGSADNWERAIDWDLWSQNMVETPPVMMSDTPTNSILYFSAHTLIENHAMASHPVHPACNKECSLQQRHQQYSH